MRLLKITCLLCFFSFVNTLSAQVTLPPSGGNQKSEVTQYMGALAFVRVNYSSPDVTGPNGQDRSGQIWGQLVPYGLTDLGFGLRKPAPWRAGANENTTITFSHPMRVQGQDIAAGTYGFHVIVEESGPWTLIFSNKSTAWGSFFYDPVDDALRVQATPEKSAFQEWLTYEFSDRQADQCTLELKWENISLPFKIEVPNMANLYVENLRNELESSPGFNYQGWVSAANYCIQNDVNLEEALTWAENGISAPFIGQENFTTLQTKANVLSKLNRADEAASVMDQAIKHPSASAFQIHAYGRQLIGEKKPKEALKVFIYNSERFEGAWPTEVGLARGYSAAGNYKEALKHAKIAHGQAPDQLNKDNLAQAIEKLERGEGIN